MSAHLNPGYYWVQFMEIHGWEPAEFDGDRWTLIGDGYETYQTDQLYAIGPAVTLHEAALVIEQARFLCDRLVQLELGSDGDAITNDFLGHVTPALARLLNTLEIEETTPVARAPLTDARQLVYLQNMLVNATLPMCDVEPVDGDFTITLTLNRRDGKTLADASLTIPIKQTRS